jgi:hypothetical protein
MCCSLFKRLNERFFVTYNENSSSVITKRTGDFAIINLDIANLLNRNISISIIVPKDYILLKEFSYDVDDKAVDADAKGAIFSAIKRIYVENVVGDEITVRPKEERKNINLVIQLPADVSSDSLAVQLVTRRKKKELSIHFSSLRKY